MTIFNDSRREWELAELCGTCGLRNGLHSMFNKCPVKNSKGTVVRNEFAESTFQGTKKYDKEALDL